MSKVLNPYARVWHKGKAVRVHRLVAAEVLGRELQPGEVIDHDDGNKANNTPENLKVLPSQRHHMVLEHLRRRKARGIQPLFDDREILEGIEK